MVRFFLVNAFIAFYTILMCMWSALLALFTKDGGRRVHFWAAVPWAKAILWVSGVRVIREGGEGLNWEVPRIYMANHQSAFDIFALLAGLPVDFKFILKQKLMKIPILGPAMRRAGYISIDRGDPRRAILSINRAAERIKQGASVLIFPEGTRSKDGRLQVFKKGGFHLASKAGVEIVPIVIFNSINIVPKGSMRINRGEITLKVCNPVPVNAGRKRDQEKLMACVREVMLQAMGEEAGEDPGSSSSGGGGC